MGCVKVLFFLFMISINLLYKLHALPTNFLTPYSPNIHKLRSCNITKIYQLGASKSDTGNRKLEKPSYLCSQIPYGESFFDKPTGRCCDGLLMIDYIASAAGLPFLNPYLDGSANFSHGVNFAVGGATTLSANTLAEKGVVLTGTHSSLGVQLDWLSTHFASLRDSDIDWHREKLQNSLFMVGEIGGNDYYFALEQGKTIEEAKRMVPEVVQFIMDAVRKVIEIGAVRVIVPGNFRMGCFPVFLTMLETNNEEAYDQFQCLKDLNKLTTFHNKQLQLAIKSLQEENPDITIVYSDFDKAFRRLLRNAPYLGFDPASTLKSCCGFGGRYNYNKLKTCGAEQVPVCPDPNQHINWDGVHLTQKAYKYLSEWLVADILEQLKCNLNILSEY